MRQVSAETRAVVVLHRTGRNLPELVKCERKYQRRYYERKSIFNVVAFVFLVFCLSSEHDAAKGARKARIVGLIQRQQRERKVIKI